MLVDVIYQYVIDMLGANLKPCDRISLFQKPSKIPSLIVAKTFMFCKIYVIFPQTSHLIKSLIFCYFSQV